MAKLTVTNGISLKGYAAAELVAPIVFGGKTLAGNYITLVEGSKNKFVVPVMSNTGLVTDDSCDYSDAGTTDLNYKQFTLEKFKVNKTICFDVLEPTTNMNRGALNTELPFEQQILQAIAAEAQDKVDYDIWNGVTANAGEFDGLLTQATAGGSGALAVGSPVALTASNILAKIQATLALLPGRVRRDHANVKIFISQDDEIAFQAALSALGFRPDYGVNNQPDYKYLGYEVVTTQMPTGKIIVTSTKNIFFGTDSQDDMNEAKLIDMRDTTGDDAVRIIMRWMGAVGVARMAELAVYSA